MNLAGKKVVVVGGSSGIGYATAEFAKRAEADVIICSRNADRLQAVGGLPCWCRTCSDPAFDSEPRDPHLRMSVLQKRRLPR